MMIGTEKLRQAGKYIRIFLSWCVLGLGMGILGGLLGAGFHHALHYVTHIRQENGWLILLLPVGGLLTVGVYKLLRLENNKGTNEVMEAVLDGHRVSPLIAPGIFAASLLTHLFGGSAGREGAALQLGGSVASLLGRWMKLKPENHRIFIMCGMSAVFAGLFGTPLTACLFTMEFVSVGTLFTPALLPCYLAAFAASRMSGVLGVHAETFALTTAMPMNVDTLWRFLVLAIAVALLGILMCNAFHTAEHLAKKWIPAGWLRILVGGSLVALLTALIGDQRYNGAGMDLALEAVSGHADWYSFLLKLVLTALTLAAGFKGGEIVPTFCIGATFGCVFGQLLGLDPGIAAAMALIGLFCCATNSPWASIVLSVEMFGAVNLHMFALMCVICFVLSGKTGLYASQILQFSKATQIGNRHRTDT